MKKLLLLGLLILFIGCPTTEINSARIYIERGEYQRAKEQVLIGLKNDPGNYELYCLLGKSEIGLSHWTEASTAFKNAIKADSLSAIKWILKDKKNVGVYWQAFYNSAVALEMEKKYDEQFQQVFAILECMIDDKEKPKSRIGYLTEDQGATKRKTQAKRRCCV